MAKRSRRMAGEGGLFQRCDRDRGCPALVPLLDDKGDPVLTAKGRPKQVRPDHKCHGMWIGTVEVGEVNGDRRTERVSATTKSRAAAKLNALKGELAKNDGVLPEKGLTVATWLDFWVEKFIRPNKKPKSYRFYRGNVDNHLIPFFGTKLTMASLERKPELVVEFDEHMVSKQWRGKPMSSTTAMHAHMTLVNALNRAKRMKKIRYNAAEVAEPPKRSKNKRRNFDRLEAKLLTSAAEKDPMGSRWLTGLYEGARQGECIGLQWPCVDWERAVFDLSWQLQRILYRHGCDDVAACTEPHHKRPCPDECPKAARTSGRPHRCVPENATGLCEPDCDQHAKACPEKELDVPPGYECRQLDGGLCLVRPKGEEKIIPMVGLVRDALKQRHMRYLSERTAYTQDHGLVWCRPDGRPIDPTDDDLAWHEFREGAGVARADLHSLRHSTGTLLLEAGVDRDVIRQILGHSSAVTTAGYKHVSVQLARGGLDSMVTYVADAS